MHWELTSPLAIPDASSVDSLVYVDGVGSPILGVRVLLHVTHASDADLNVSLVGPDGTTVVLTSDNGGAGADYGEGCTPDASRTTFDDAASASVTDGAAPFAGAFRPEQVLDAFDGKAGAGAANGIWRLRVADDTAGATGTLRCWSLLITAEVKQVAVHEGDAGGGRRGATGTPTWRRISLDGPLTSTAPMLRIST